MLRNMYRPFFIMKKIIGDIIWIFKNPLCLF